MATPTIRYATTADGASIANAMGGQGPPLVYCQPYSHQQLDWTVPEIADWLSRLGEGRRLLRYDMRRFGLSDRTEAPLSLATLVDDLTAVVDHAGLDQFDLFGISGLGMPAIQFAADHPERVRRLLLWGVSAHGADLFQATELLLAIDALTAIENRYAIELQALANFGEEAWQRPECVTHAQETLTPSALRAYMGAVRDTDVRHRLADIQCPTLLMLPQSFSFASLQTTREIAAAIPDCQLAYCDGSVYPYRGNGVDERIGLIRGFLGTTAADRPDVSGVQTIMFTDLESSTALTQALGDARAQGILRAHNDTVRSALDAHGGKEVKHTGDGIMAAFSSAVNGVEAALHVQDQLRGGEVRVRIGLNAGEPIAEDGDYFGSAVQLAARVCDQAEPGQVLVSQVVRDLCRGKDFRFDTRGEVALKGFPESVRLFEVRGAD